MRNMLFNKKAVRSITDTTVANAFNIFTLALSTFIIPKLIDVRAYSYWQLYHLYITYVGFFHFGWADGIYLQQGGKKYSELDQKELHTQYKLYLIFELIVSVIVFIAGWAICDDADKLYVIGAFATCIFITVTSAFLQYLLQCTDRISEYARVLIVERILYVILLAVLIVVGVRDYRPIIAADLIPKTVTLILLTIKCKDIVFCNRIKSFAEGIKDAWQNVSIGSKLMIANIAGLLLTGIVKTAIELKWGIETFGKASLTMSVSNLVMVFVSAVSIVLYPILKNTEDGQKAETYGKLRKAIVWLTLGAMVFYYPLYKIVGLWLPQYEDGLKYMALLFPICLFESKTNLLCNTYFKALREEKKLMWLNIIAVIITIAVTVITVEMMNSVPFAMLGLMVSLGIRNTILEAYLWRKLNIHFTIDMIIEWIMVILFCLISWNIQSWMCMVWYAMVFGIFVCVTGLRNIIKKEK